MTPSVDKFVAFLISRSKGSRRRKA